MSKTVDERVVSMQFDNKNFEQNVSTSMSTLEKLKQKLSFKGATKGLESIDSAAKKVNMTGLASAVDTVGVRFSTLQVVATTALANITNSAINAAKSMASQFTIDPIVSGFQEYETQLNSVQTILANTQHEGTNINQVNEALNELNTYADKTIYNFTEMTRNIGTFTAAGVGLQKSVDAIKGIANLAAVSGSTSQQASTAMYQLSQALAAGRVSLMDWNSVVNAGMGGKVFQDALKRTATQMGTNVDAMIAKYGSFRESLTEGGWLTADVLTETLKQFSGAYTEADLIQQGYSESQAAEIVKMAQTAEDAATKVKTFTQLIDTVKEALGSGWAQTWQLLFGDFEEAKSLWTGVSDVVSGFVNDMSNSRNDLLGGALNNNLEKMTEKLETAGVSSDKLNESLSKTLKNNKYDVDALTEKYGSLTNAFKEGAVPVELLTKTLDSLKTKTVDLSKVSAGLKLKDGFEKASDEVSKVQEVLTSLGYDIGKIDGKFGENTQNAIKEFQKLKGLKVTGIVDEATLSALREAQSEAQNLWKDIDTLAKGITELGGRELLIDSLKNTFNGLLSILSPIKESFREVFPKTTSDQLFNLIENIHKITEGFKLSETSANNLKRTFKGLFSVLDIGKKAVTSVLKPFGDFLFGGSFGSAAGSLLEITASIGDMFTSLNEGLESGKGFSVISDVISSALSAISSGLKSITGGVSGVGDFLSSFGSKIADVFNGIMDVVDRIKENIGAEDIFAGLLGGGLFVFLKNLGGLFKQAKNLLGGGLKGLLFGDDDDADSIVSKFSGILDGVHGALSSFSTGLNVASLVGIAGAIMMLSSSLRTLSEIEPVKMAYSVVAIAAMMAVLNSGFRSMSKTLTKFNPKGTIRASVAMMAMAKAIDILANAMNKMSGLSWRELLKGLVGVGGSLLALSGAFNLISRGGKINLRSSIAILAIAQACKMLSEALAGFSELSWSEIGRGLTAMGGALLELTGALAIMSKAGGFGSLLGSVGLLIAVQSLSAISENLKKLGELSWSEIGKGLAAMGGALAEFTIALGVLSKVGGFGSILGGTGLLIAVQSLFAIAEGFERLGSLSWDNIGKGLTAMGGALTEFTIALGVLSKVGGFGSILGGTGLLIAVQSLDEISENLERLGYMSWSEIGKGLTAMGGALAELGAVSGLLGKLTGISGLIGAGSIVLATQSLEKIADALSKFGFMNWDEIGKGLTAMGGALAETGLAAGLTGLAGLSGLIGGGSILIAAQGLSDIAVALQKFGSMNWDEIGKGLTAMGGALAETGLAAGLTGLAGLAGLVGGGTILMVSNGLIDIATALQKFGSMNWDEIGRGLAAMGGALAETALGGLLNTLSGLGAASIATVAEPLGQLADSVKKWAGVTVPEGLGDQLGSLADGVKKFTFGGLGAGAISTVAEPLGTMAASVNKWAGVTVPEGMGEKLSELADGIKSFTFAFAGGASMSVAADPLGQLASSINKWAGVTVPEGIGDKLSELAGGIESFTFAFAGGWSMDAVVGPLGQLADSISKWSNITVPDNLGDGLKSIADGISNFSLFSSWGIDKVPEPMSNLADAMEKWDDVTIPENLGDSLKNLSDGIKNFGITSDWGIKDIAEPISNLGTAMKSWNGVYISPAIGENLPMLADGLKSLKGIKLDSLSGDSANTAISNIKNLVSSINGMGSINTESIESFKSAIETLSKVSFEGIATAMSGASTQVQTALSNLVNSISISLGTGMAAIGVSANNAGKTIGTSISTGLQSGTSNISTVVSSVVSSISSSFTSKASSMKSVGVSMGTNLASGINSSMSTTSAKISSSVSSIITAVSSKAGAFRTSGATLINSLNSGLMSGSNTVVSSVNSIMTKAKSTIDNKASAFRTSGSNLITQLAGGMSGRTSAVTGAVASIMSSASATASGYYSSFYSAGANLAAGFAAGISANSYMAAARASAMASAAAAAARSALAIHSPSRVMYEIGDFAGKGFINALSTYASISGRAGSEMANSTISGLKDTLSNMGSVIDSGIDINPTIRPILDMSDVRSGLNTINGISGLSPSLSVLASVRGINSAVNSRNQNGVNDDVISELKRLRTGIREMPRNSYNINGITYDDGSAIGEAVSALVRAARIEGRV